MYPTPFSRIQTFHTPRLTRALSNEGNTLIKFAFAGAVLLSLICGTWLYFAYSQGNRTKDWTAVPAKVTSNDADIATDLRGRSRGVREWITSVTYHIDGVSYDAVLDDYLVGENATVFVNPDDPTDVVGETGPRMQDTFYPIVATVFSGCLALVIALIAFSPADD